VLSESTGTTLRRRDKAQLWDFLNTVLNISFTQARRLLSGPLHVTIKSLTRTIFEDSFLLTGPLHVTINSLTRTIFEVSFLLSGPVHVITKSLTRKIF
jgi:hypothetical protein